MGEIKYNIAAICIQGICLAIYNSRSKLYTSETKIFFLLLIISFMTVLFDTLSVITYWYALSLPLWILYLVNMLYFLCYNTMPLLMFFFIYSLGTKKAVTKKRIFPLWGLPWLVVMLIILSTPWTDCAFAFDAQRNYHRGKALPCFYIVTLYFLALCAYYLIKERKFISRKKLISVVLFLPFSFIPLIIQFIKPEILITNFGVSLSILIILFTILDFGNLIDPETNIFNRNGFLEQLKILSKKGESFSAILFCINNNEFLKHGLGMHAYSKLQPYITSKTVKNINETCFCAQFDQGKYVQIATYKKIADEIASTIVSFFSKPVFFNGLELQISARIVRIEFPSDTKNISSIYRAMYLLSRKNENYQINTVLPASEVLKEEETRRIVVSNKIKQAVIDNSFMVYFQPIVDTQTGKLISAEALIRYKDTELGWISPAEFIPLAEQTGIIGSIGNLVLETTCSFLTTVRTLGYTLGYIEVNLSPLQCLQNNLAQEMFHIVQSYGLGPEDICFEITETAKSLSKEIMRETIEELIEFGFSIAIDDYGSGYSNMLNLLSIGFDYIKIDRSIIVTGEKDKKGLTALKAIISLFKPLETVLIAEGVETIEQLEMVKEAEIDLIQGYYFSRPLCTGDFIQYLASASKEGN